MNRFSSPLFVAFALIGCGTTATTDDAVSPGTTASASAMASTSSSAAPGTFSLLYRDDFETLDSSRWQLMTHSWGGNLALFSSEAVAVESGQLVITLLPAPEGTTDQGESKSFLGAEVRSRDTLTYGRVTARAKFARGSAVISSLVTIYTPWPADDWNELDIECLGADPSNLQFNAQVYTGPAVEAPVTQAVSPTPDEQRVTLDFDPSADFHVYTIEWTPTEARFLVDEELKHTWTTHIDRMDLPQNVLLTIWASSSAGWAGVVDAGTVGAFAAYDWIELYRYVQ